MPSPDAPSNGTVHMVLDDFGQFGRTWREANAELTDEQDIVHGIVSGEYRKPIKVFAFNLHEGWVRDVTQDIARAVIDTALAEGRTLGPIALEFIARATGKDAPADLKEVSQGNDAGPRW